VSLAPENDHFGKVKRNFPSPGPPDADKNYGSVLYFVKRMFSQILRPDKQPKTVSLPRKVPTLFSGILRKQDMQVTKKNGNRNLFSNILRKHESK